MGIAVSGVVVAASLACGSGAVEGPGDDGGAIGLQLPVGNETAAAAEDAGPVEEQVYAAVAEGDCAAGQDLLDEDWASLDSPRAVLLYDAVTAACEGDLVTANARLDEALAIDPGFTADTLECIAYQALIGFVGRPPDECTSTGPGPAWPAGDVPAERVDPRTASVDETTTSDTTTPSESTTSSSEEGPTTTPLSPTTSGGIEAEGDLDVSAGG